MPVSVNYDLTHACPPVDFAAAVAPARPAVHRDGAGRAAGRLRAHGAPGHRRAAGCRRAGAGRPRSGRRLRAAGRPPQPRAAVGRRGSGAAGRGTRCRRRARARRTAGRRPAQGAGVAARRAAAGGVASAGADPRGRAALVQRPGRLGVRRRAGERRRRPPARASGVHAGTCRKRCCWSRSGSC